MRLYKHNPAMGTSSGSVTIVMEATIERAGRTTLSAASGLVEIGANKPFYNLLANMTSKPMYISMYVIGIRTTYSPVHIIPIEAALVKYDPKKIGALSYKFSGGRKSRIVFPSLFD